MTPKMEEIWHKLRLLATYDPNLTVFGAYKHRYRIYPRLTEDQIRDFELSFRVSLPEDYRRFLSEIANGGAGPDYGLKRLEASVRKVDMPLLTLPFPHREDWNLKHSQFSSMEEFNEQYERDDLTQGTLSICDMGCGYEVLLVVTGEERGTIWQDLRAGDQGIIPLQNAQTGASRTSFSEWYETWLDTSLAT